MCCFFQYMILTAKRIGVNSWICKGKEAKRQRGKILIIDDSSVNIQLLNEILKNEHDICFALNGEDGLSLAIKEQPDLILLDIIMPKIDGYEVCNRLKANEQTKNLPIIFITVTTGKLAEEKCLNMKAVDYIKKPFESSIVKLRVRNHLELKRNSDLLLNISRDLVIALEENRRQNEGRKELLHVLCHDLINPIGFSLRLIQELKEDPSLFPDFINFIENSLENGIGVIRSVQKMIAMDEGKINFDLTAECLIDLVNESVAMIKQRLVEKELNLQINIDPTLMVKVEKTFFVNSILNNLLTNAIKFSSNGSEIVLNAKDDGIIVILSVKDHGIGIPEDILENIFDPSKTTSRIGTNGEKGTGFGMPLIKKVIKAIGGNISIESIEKKKSSRNHGTVVSLELLRNE